MSKQRKFIEVVHPGDVVYDVGANVGVYTLLTSVLVGSSGSVVAFEPVPDNLAFLRRHVTLNDLDNVEVVAAAVADTDGEARFSLGGHPSVGRLHESGELVVRQVTLDAFFQEPGRRPPAALKIDVEGGELLVLNGARKLLAEHCPTVFVATHSPQLLDDCRSLLEGFGYMVEAVASDPNELLATPAVGQPGSFVGGCP